MFSLGTAKLIGVGVLALALIGSIIWLIQYAEDNAKKDLEIARLEKELVRIEKSRETAIGHCYDTVRDWIKKSSEWQMAYTRELAKAPRTEVIYRDVAATVPQVVPLGDCDRAATNAYDLLIAIGDQ